MSAVRRAYVSGQWQGAENASFAHVRSRQKVGRQMDDALRQRIHRIDALVQQLRASDSELTAGALELLQIVMDLHGAALDRLMEIVAESGDAGWHLIESFGRDETVGNILLLHGLHP